MPEDIQAPLRAGEHFAGLGAAHAALRACGVEVVYANDMDPEKAAIYEANHGLAVDPRPIQDVRGWELPRFDFGHGSPSCTTFSVSGNGLGLDDPRGMTAFEYLRVVCEIDPDARPRALCIENVPGLLTSNGGADYALLHGGLVSLGYRVGPVVLDGVRWVPQARRRAFIVAVRRDVRIPAGLTSRKSNPDLHPTEVHTARAALSPAHRRDFVWWKLPEPPPRPLDLVDIIDGDEEVDPRLWCTDRAHDEAARLMAEDGWEAIARMQAGGGAGVLLNAKRRTNGVVRRVKTVLDDGHARTLVRGDGHAGQRLVIPARNSWGFRLRRFSVRELARLTGLPDDFVLPTSVAAAKRATGDAIIVPAYEHLARHLLVPLAQAQLGPMRRKARAEVMSVKPRPLPRRNRTVRDPDVGRANRPMKRACRAITVYVPHEAHEVISARAAANGRTMQEEIIAPYNKALIGEGALPLPQYVAQPRRGTGDPGPRGGRRRSPAGARQSAPRGGSGRVGNPGITALRGGGARGRIQAACTPLRYPGGKAKVASKLVRLLHGTSCLVEPYAGSAAVSVRAIMTNAVGHAVLAEKDRDVHAVWDVTCGASEDEFRTLLHEVRAALPDPLWWEEFRDRAAGDEAPHLRAAFALLRGRFHRNGIWNAGVRSATDLRDALRLDSMIARLLAIRGHARRFTIRGDAMEAIREFSHVPGAGFFVDPPYSLPGGPAAHLYRHHEVDHARLLDTLSQVRGRVVATYDDRKDVRAMAGQHGFRVQPLGIRDGHRRMRQELLLTRGTGPP